jgi:hypothetical protein
MVRLRVKEIAKQKGISFFTIYASPNTPIFLNFW